MANSRARANKSANPPPRLRIIGGRHRGRKLPIADVPGLRPTGDRIRETLFNWLAPHLPGARVLDLFAGSGALGLEAVSRGAGEVVLCELDSRAAEHIAQALTLLQAANARLQQGDALALLRRAPHQSFEIVFIDPPFAAGFWQACIDLLEPWLAPGALVYIESDTEAVYRVPEHWRSHRDKRTGRVHYCLYRVETAE